MDRLVSPKVHHALAQVQLQIYKMYIRSTSQYICMSLNKNTKLQRENQLKRWHIIILLVNLIKMRTPKILNFNYIQQPQQNCTYQPIASSHHLIASFKTLNFNYLNAIRPKQQKIKSNHSMSFDTTGPSISISPFEQQRASKKINLVIAKHKKIRQKIEKGGNSNIKVCSLQLNEEMNNIYGPKSQQFEKIKGQNSQSRYTYSITNPSIRQSRQVNCGLFSACYEPSTTEFKKSNYEEIIHDSTIKRKQVNAQINHFSEMPLLQKGKNDHVLNQQRDKSSSFSFRPIQHFQLQSQKIEIQQKRWPIRKRLFDEFKMIKRSYKEEQIEIENNDIPLSIIQMWKMNASLKMQDQRLQKEIQNISSLNQNIQF